jgi:transposase-like protein
MRTSYTPTFKAQVVREVLKEEITAGHVAAKYDVHPTQLHQRKVTAIKGLPNLFVDQQKARDSTKAQCEQQLSELYEELGTLTTRLARLKKRF